jgi:hypothetical protein
MRNPKAIMLDKAAALTTLAVRSLMLLLVTMMAIGVWMLVDLDTVGALENPEGAVKVDASRVEFLLVLVLLFLNVAMAYAMYRRFHIAGKNVRFSLGTIIASLLAMCVWIGLRFLPSATDFERLQSGNASINKIEILAAMVLILVSVLGLLLMLRRYLRAKPVLVMSAYSKKVCLNGKWMSIEEYLGSELGIEISHGMTAEERDSVMQDFTERSAKEGIPRPSAGDADTAD